MKAGVGNKRTYNGLGHRRNTTSTKQKKEKQRAYRVLKSEKLRIQATKDLESTKSIKLAVDAPHVAIVGGGAAGLASLRCLLALGCNVTLFDRVSLSKQKGDYFYFRYQNLDVQHCFIRLRFIFGCLHTQKQISILAVLKLIEYYFNCI